MLDNVGLVHMNGRVYDPAIGRFISADPFIDGWTNPQGWNRYAYVKGRPLSSVDPTGFLEEIVVRARRDRPWESFDGGYDAPRGRTEAGRLGTRPVVDDGDIGRTAEGLEEVVVPGLQDPDFGDGTPIGTEQANHEQAQKPHHYEIDVILGLCVSPNEGFDVMRNFATPGGGHAQDGTHDVELWGGNWIQQTVDPAALTITNVAIPGRHVFGGYVRISMHQRNGVTGAHIEGGGSGPNAEENQFWGPAIFEALGLAAFTSIPCNGVGAL